MKQHVMIQRESGCGPYRVSCNHLIENVFAFHPSALLTDTVALVLTFKNPETMTFKEIKCIYFSRSLKLISAGATWPISVISKMVFIYAIQALFTTYIVTAYMSDFSTCYSGVFLRSLHLYVNKLLSQFPVQCWFLPVMDALIILKRRIHAITQIYFSQRPLSFIFSLI